MGKIRNIYLKLRNLRYTAAILLALIIAVQGIVMVFACIEQKTSYYCDEVFSYGLSNSFYRPFLESEDIRSDAEYKINEWFSGKEFKDYLTVQEGQRFRYDSVWYNQSMDRHPPLYYSCLHTICSFFPDTFSFLFGYILNFVFFAVMQVFMYKFGKNLLRSRYAALTLCLVFGFTPFALNMTLFIRMYLMLTMFMVILLYYHSRLIKLDRTDIKKWKLFLPLSLVTLGGALTQYLFLFAAFGLAVCFCLRYLFQKRFKLFLIYSLSMLAGVLVSFAVYPAAVRELFGEIGGAVKILFQKQIVIGLRYLFDVNCGLSSSDIVWYLTVFSSLLFFAVLVSVPIVYLLRDRTGIKKILAPLRNVPKRIKSCGIKGLFVRIKSCNPMPVMMLAVSAEIIIVVSYTVRFSLGFAERYFFIVSPMIFAVLFSLFCLLFRRLKIRNVLITLFSVFMLFSVSKNYNVVSCMTYKNDIDLHETAKDRDVLVLSVDMEYAHKNMSTYAYELYEADRVFFSTYHKYKPYLDDIVSSDSASELCVMLNYADTNENDRGKYLLNNLDGKDREEDRVYLDELFAELSARGKPEYVGTYDFIEGVYLIYCFA